LREAEALQRAENKRENDNALNDLTAQLGVTDISEIKFWRKLERIRMVDE
jgi:hypothetical protein